MLYRVPLSFPDLKIHNSHSRSEAATAITIESMATFIFKLNIFGRINQIRLQLWTLQKQIWFRSFYDQI